MQTAHRLPHGVEHEVNRPLGYLLFTFSMIPSWSLMLAVSFFSRSLM